MRIQTTIAEALMRTLESRSADLHTAIPGIVRSYNATNQTADIEPALLRVVPAADEEVEDPRERLPVLPAVPIAWPRAGGFFLHFPLAAGDSVLLVFCESDINAWRASGQVSDPGTFERHVLSGAVAVPGVYPRDSTIGDASGTHGRIGKDGGAYVEFRPSEIRVGGSKALAEDPNLAVHLDAIAAGMNALATALAGGAPTEQPNYGVAARTTLNGTNPIATTVTKGD